MSTLDQWISRSQNQADVTAQNDGKLAQFQRGSWWAAFQFGEALPWQNMNGLRNHLVTVDPTKHYKELAAERLAVVWVAKDTSSNYWHVSPDGYGFWRASLSEDYVDRPQVEPQVRFFRRRPVDDAFEVFEYILRLAKVPFTVQMGWSGLKGRTLIDPKANEWNYGTATENVAQSDPLKFTCEELAGDQIVSAIHSLTDELYRAFHDSKVTAELIAKWLGDRPRTAGTAN